MRQPRTRQRAWQMKKQNEGICPYCGTRPLFSTSACEPCLIRRRKENRARKGVEAWVAGGKGRPPLILEEDYEQQIEEPSDNELESEE